MQQVLRGLTREIVSLPLAAGLGMLLGRASSPVEPLGMRRADQIAIASEAGSLNRYEAELGSTLAVLGFG
jgi:hypothetical protein